MIEWKEYQNDILEMEIHDNVHAFTAYCNSISVGRLCPTKYEHQILQNS